MKMPEVVTGNKAHLQILKHDFETLLDAINTLRNGPSNKLFGSVNARVSQFNGLLKRAKEQLAGEKGIAEMQEIQPAAVRPVLNPLDLPNLQEKNEELHMRTTELLNVLEAKSSVAEPAEIIEPYVFISHSSKDTTLVSVVKQAFADLPLTPNFVEEKPAGAPPTRELAQAVRKSRALFVLFTSYSSYGETRDWVIFELGVAVAHNRPIYCWKQSGLTKEQLPRLLEQVTTYREFDTLKPDWQTKLIGDVRAAAKAL